MFLKPQTVFFKGFVILSALLSVFIVGLIVGLIAGLIIGNTAIGDALLELLYTYQAMLDQQFE